MTTSAKPKTENLRRMQLFNDKVNELRQSSFVWNMVTRPSGVTVSWRAGQGQPTAEVRGPGEESIKSMILDVRFMMQNDPQSLRNMAELYERLPTDSPHKTNFLKVRADINAYLDRKVESAIIRNQEELTNRRVLELILYGEKAHTNPDKQAVLDSLRPWSAVTAILKNAFNTVALHFLDEVFHLQIENASLYEELTGEKLVIKWPETP